MKSAPLAFVAGLLLLVPLLVTPVLPLVDFYDHVARYFVLSHIDSDPVLAANYAADWKLLPNLGLDALATPLLDVAPPLLAAKIIIGFILIVQFTGVLFLHRGLWGRLDPLPIAVLLGLLYSYILTWGFGNFLLACGLVFWNLGLWVRLRHNLPLATLVCGLGALVIFFCHGLAFAVYGLLLGSFEIGRWREERRTLRTLVLRMGALAVQALLPAILFLQMSTATATAPTAVDPSMAEHSEGTLAQRLAIEFWDRLETIFRVAESPYATLDYATFSFTGALVVWALWRGWIKVHRAAWAPIAVVVAFCVLMPPTLFGVGRISDRFPLILALLGAAALATGTASSRAGRRVVIAIALVSLLRIGAVSLGWSDYGRHYAAMRQVTATIPRGALVGELLVYKHSQRKDLQPRCEMYRPLELALNGGIVPLFAVPSQQPLRLIGPLAEADKTMGVRQGSRFGPPHGYFDAVLARTVAGQGYDYLLMCGRNLLTRPLPPGVTIAAEADGLTVLKLK